MNPHFERAQLLFQQSRYDLAEESLRRTLADDPDFAMAHGLLALCMLQRQAYKEATEEAERAVRLEPNVPFMHYVLAHVFLQRNRLEEAEQAAKTAVELNPYDADLHCVLGNIYMAQRRWTAALDQADEGLRLDAEHTGSSNLRATSLVKLGRKDEADRVMVGVLARNPEDAFSQANQGWTALNQSDPKKALEHFREALRLDPTLEYAQAGMVEALKARYLVYRLMLRWFLWMGRQGRTYQWLIIIGLYVGTQIIGDAARNNPNLGPILKPIWGLLIGFAVMTWLAMPMFNLLLRFNRYGKHMLSRDQKTSANMFGAFLLLGIGVLIYGLNQQDDIAMLIALAIGIYLLVVTGVFLVPSGMPRLLMSCAAIGLAGLAIYAFWLFYAAQGRPIPIGNRMQDEGENCFKLYCYGVLGCNIATNVLMQIRPKR
jgi:tetratricopeptide (TPR) repeat protein